MRFNPKKKIEPGIERIVKRFAFFPITEVVKTDDIRYFRNGETRWLETVYIKQVRVEGFGGELGGMPDDHWDSREFVTKEIYETFKELHHEI
jgi:hypothetical protein